METNNNSAMKKLNVGEAVVQMNDRKLGKLHVITPRNQACLWTSILPIMIRLRESWNESMRRGS